MIKSFRLALTVAAAGISPALPAFAADYDPPIFVDQAPEMVPVEVGSGWYLRGDIGYNFNSDFYDYDFSAYPGVSTSQDSAPVFASIGSGYHFSDYFRAEANIGFLTSDSLDINFNDNFGSTSAAWVDTDLWSGIINGYVDLGTYVGITPYIGAGAGMVYSQTTVGDRTVYPNGAEFYQQDENNEFSFAYTLNAGASYQVTQNASIDIGYQYFSAPDARTVSTDNFKVESDGVDFHQIKVGLRYDLW
jgi:opacity protein-like surface antigen